MILTLLVAAQIYVLFAICDAGQVCHIPAEGLPHQVFFDKDQCDMAADYYTHSWQTNVKFVCVISSYTRQP